MILKISNPLVQPYKSDVVTKWSFSGEAPKRELKKVESIWGMKLGSEGIQYGSFMSNLCHGNDKNRNSNAKQFQKLEKYPGYRTGKTKRIKGKIIKFKTIGVTTLEKFRNIAGKFE